MAGLEVTPTMPSSIMRRRPPFFMSSRESSSTQGACPSSRILAKRSFICCLLTEPNTRTVCIPFFQSTPATPQGMLLRHCVSGKSSLPSNVLNQTPRITHPGLTLSLRQCLYSWLQRRLQALSFLRHCADGWVHAGAGALRTCCGSRQVARSRAHGRGLQDARCSVEFLRALLLNYASV